MDFNEFRNRVIGMDAGKPKATIGFMRCIPVPSEDEPGAYEASIEDVIAITKPEIDLIYVTDPSEMAEFIELRLKFLSNYDPDINEVYNYLIKYQDDIQENLDKPEKRPSMVVYVVPQDIFQEGMFYMEMYTPLMINLVSSRLNKLPDTISLLFTVDQCTLTQDDNVDLPEVRKEFIRKQEEERREIEVEEERLRKEVEQEEKQKQLQEQLLNTSMEDHVIRVGRMADENKED